LCTQNCTKKEETEKKKETKKKETLKKNSAEPIIK
jgi:hypothetical protein